MCGRGYHLTAPQSHLPRSQGPVPSVAHPASGKMWGPNLPGGSLVVISRTQPGGSRNSSKKQHQVCQVPLFWTAINKWGSAGITSLLTVSHQHPVLHLASRESCEKGVAMHIPKDSK